MREFSPPLSRLAIAFNETWEFSRIGRDTRVVRSFELHATSRVTRPLLWLISILLKSHRPASAADARVQRLR